MQISTRLALLLLAVEQSLVSLTSMYANFWLPGAYIVRAKIDLLESSILDPKVFAGLLFGAMLPYWVGLRHHHACIAACFSMF